MTTWIGHLRLAQNTLSHGFKLDWEKFTIGNISPDCGESDGNGGFIPPSSVTHFGQNEAKADPQLFYTQHVQGKTFEPEQYAFMMGYYAHLIADVEWAMTVYRPKKVTPLWAEGLSKDPQFIWEIKKDWYGHDFIYLHNHPNSLFYTTFNHVTDVPDYLNFVPDGNFTKTVKRIRDYYNNEENMQLSLAHDYPYLSQAEMDDYIERTSVKIINALEAIGVEK